MNTQEDLTHHKINIPANWEEFVYELRGSKRDGVDDLISWLEENTDIKTAPASTKYHLSCKGGLVEHSLNTLRYIRKVSSLHPQLAESEDSITIVSLLHDLCKVNYYKAGKEWDKEWKEKTNQWREKQVWKVEDKIPLGHGEKSLLLANKFLDLYTAEQIAIRWHMGGYDPATHFFYPSGSPFKQSMDQYPLLKVLMLADQHAELFESYYYDPFKGKG